MKKILQFLVFFGLLVVLSPSHIWAAESITNFESDITINQDTSLSIQETLRYETDEEHHGIYRYVPIRYTVNGLNVVSKVDVESVTDEAQRAYQYETSRSNDNLTLKIGDPDTTFTGTKTYIISYRVENALKRYETHDELYWDITGEGWNFPVEKTLALVRSPHAEIEKAVCYAGTIGSDNQRCKVVNTTKQTVAFAYPDAVTYGENMTIVVGLNRENQLQFPTQLEKNIRQIIDNLYLGILLLPGTVLLWMWWRRGRDSVFMSPNVFDQDASQPQSKLLPWTARRVPFVYEPIKDLTPGEAGVMLDESAGNEDVIAEILELARKKYLKLEQIETKKLFGKQIDYRFTQLKPADEKLPPVQKYLHESLFKNRTTVALSELKGSFYIRMEKAKNMLYDALTRKKLFVSHPKRSKETAWLVLFFLGVVAVIIFFTAIENQQWLAFPLFLISLVVAITSALQMPAKTAVGSNYAMQAQGLKETIARGKWREEIKEKHLFIEDIFTFAVAFGVVDRLTKDMEKLNIEPPTYLNQAALNHIGFTSFAHSFTQQASQSMSYNPSSSSSSGGSGFSGGSSGGGGGGGGGGSW